METNSLICSANEWIGFYKIGTSIMKELMNLNVFRLVVYTNANYILKVRASCNNFVLLKPHERIWFC